MPLAELEVRTCVVRYLRKCCVMLGLGQARCWFFFPSNMFITWPDLRAISFDTHTISRGAFISLTPQYIVWQSRFMSDILNNGAGGD